MSAHRAQRLTESDRKTIDEAGAIGGFESGRRRRRRELLGIVRYHLDRHPYSFVLGRRHDWPGSVPLHLRDIKRRATPRLPARNLSRTRELAVGLPVSAGFGCVVDRHASVAGRGTSATQVEGRDSDAARLSVR